MNDEQTERERISDVLALYVTRTAAAEMLGVDPSMVGAYIRGGRLEGAFKLGHIWAIPWASVEELARVWPEGGFKRGRKKGKCQN